MRHVILRPRVHSGTMAGVKAVLDHCPLCCLFWPAGMLAGRTPYTFKKKKKDGGKKNQDSH